MDIRFEATLESSLVHGGGTDGSNITLFRRETICAPDGTVTTVPVMSGNGFRGVLRRHGAWLLASLIGATDGGLGVNAVRIISSGGALKQETGLPPEQTHAVRQTPHLGLFGWSGLGDIHPGSLVVGKLVPVCAETTHLTGVASPVRSARLLQLEQFTRHDSTPVTADEANGEPDTTQMIYQVETLAGGVRLVGRLGLRPWATPDQMAWLHATLAAWVDSGSHLGGRSASGHGRLIIDPAIIDPAAAEYARAAAKASAAELVERLRWLH